MLNWKCIILAEIETIGRHANDVAGTIREYSWVRVWQ